MIAAAMWCIFVPVTATAGMGAPPNRQRDQQPPADTDAAAAVDSARDAWLTSRIDWASVDTAESQILESMLESPDWAFRALALMRLDRYRGEGVDAHIMRLLEDDAWQVRCFAIRHAWMHGCEMNPALFESEEDARVIRTLLQHGGAIDEETLTAITARLLRTRTVDALLLGIELGAASANEGIRDNAARRTINLIQNMNPQVAAVIGRRLAGLLQVEPAPANIVQWRQWVSSVPRGWTLPAPVVSTALFEGESIIADADADTFARLRDYMGALRQRDLELVICMDSTTSMAPMIDAVKADVDALILFLSDISSTLRLGILAYRDHDNPGRLVEAHPFSTDLESLRNFLFGLATPGGATYPEAVLAGIDACRQFEWNKQATREIILIGDAPPHDASLSDLRRLLDSYREAGFTVHAVHVPMVWQPGYLQSLPAAQAQQQETWRSEYNIVTRGVFGDIARFGGGQLVELDTTSAQSDLVRRIMKLTIQQEWWAYFDAFYDAYLELCR